MKTNLFINRYIAVDVVLIVLFAAVLGIHYSNFLPVSVDVSLIVTMAVIGLLPVAFSAFRSLIRKEISMDLLSGLALFLSIVVGEWVSALFIAMMLTAARIFNDWNQERAKRGIESLLKFRSENVKVEKNEVIQELSVSEIKIGDTVVGEIGKRLAIDGEVIDGTASVDESSLTGESLPVEKSVGSKVWSSTLIIGGHIHVRAERIGKDTALEKIIELVENSHKNKPRLNTLAEKFGKIYLIGIFAVALLIYFLTYNLSLVLAIVLVVCADDVAVAIPLAFLVGVGAAAKNGVIIKGNSHLEALGKIETILFDKTGTLTKGALKVESMKTFGVDEASFLTVAGTVALESEHPVSKAILQCVHNKGALISSVERYEEVSGRGITAVIDDKEIKMGKKEFLLEQGINFTEAEQKEIEQAESSGFTVTLVSVDKKLIGIFLMADELKENLKEVVKDLSMLGVKRIEMLTGDNEKVAKRVALNAGITEYYSGISPEDKVNLVKKLLNQQTVTVMVGDGVNDAAALAQADVGIVMGGIGYDVAIESADIVLMKDDLSKIPEVIRLSRRIKKVAVEDFWIWGITNVFGLALVLFGFIGPTGAATYNFISDFFPMLNSLKVYRISRKKNNDFG